MSKEDQLELLGLPASEESILDVNRLSKAIAESRDVKDRIIHLLKIHEALRILFPRNRELTYGWMTTPNRAFKQMTPAKAIKAWGFTGLLAVETYLKRSLNH